MPCLRNDRSRPPALSAFLAATLLVALTSAIRADDVANADQMRFFESKIRPVLVDQCVKCHGADKQKSGLRLDSRSAALAGGDVGPAVVPGKPDESLLISAVRHEDDQLKMPPSRKLSAQQISDLTRWVEMGAPWPSSHDDANDAAPASPRSRKGDKVITDADRAHWAFQPVKRVIPPQVSNAAWVKNPIDAFILAGLDARRLPPNPPASRHELIRRAYYDITGLPPTPEDVDAFVNDTTADAYERLVDRLLDSPHYGEKWARHWLDLVRFAETNSYERDNPKPSAWRYRDYVIRSFNQDKPYDRFIREQLAGDEIAPGDSEALIATGYYRLGIWDDEPTDREQARYDGLDDIVATTGQVFLGLTVDCARCHEHKIDPIPQHDYYRLLAFFQNINHYRNGGPTDEAPIFQTAQDRQTHENRVRALKDRRDDLQSKIATIENELRANARSETTADVRQLIRQRGEELLGKEKLAFYQSLKRDLKAIEAEKIGQETALCITEAGPVAPETFVLLRGNPHTPGDKVNPGFLSVLGLPDPVIPTSPAGSKSSGRRTVLADWIASPANPLSGRVIVNRLWQHHFGRGIVRSSNNFGTQGDRPTHPELLDWLTSQLTAGGWKLKALHRLIMTSNAYQMSSRGNPESFAKDPMNDAFWRFDMRRLTAEEIRDSVLAVSGSLNPTMYGPGIYPEIPAEVMAGQSQPGKGWGHSPPSEAVRRSVYIHVKRSLLVPILEGFDLAETDRSSPVRFSTTQPTQALAMLNGKFLNEQADLLAARLRREAGDDPDAQVRRAFKLLMARPASDAEIRRGVDLMTSLKARGGKTIDPLSAFSLVVLNLNEFLYLD